MSVAIKVENLSKIYRLGEIGTGTISQDLDRWFKMNILGKDDPFLKIGESNNRSEKGNSDLVYSLQDLNFEIEQGDTVGIIGRNGAGKSTLLKILSRVTTPTRGKVNIKGRVASLLEVGTGFHPELTGRENIYLNGAILGMRRREIDRKLDEIIDFSGVERYIDTPVKRYSSGMYVRLAFAIAANLESEILIVDEVLAVGDAEFQKKCLGKMGEVQKSEERTVVFVSHNMAAIKNLCKKCILLSNGQLKFSDNTTNVLLSYVNLQEKYIEEKLENKSIDSTEVIRTNIELRYKESELYLDFDIETILEFQNDLVLDDCYVNFVVEDYEQLVLLHHRTDFTMNANPCFEVGRHYVKLKIPSVNLKSGVYSYWFRLFCRKDLKEYIIDSDKTSFEVIGKVFGGIINGSSHWEIK